MWESTPLLVAGRPARARVTGSGAPLVLLHGGWGGAEAHWGSVVDRLAAQYRVIAPELPGIMEGEALPSYIHYARWVLGLLDVLAIQERVICVGNSLGAAITTSLAAIAPERLSAIVLVNGGTRADRVLAVCVLLRALHGQWSQFLLSLWRLVLGRRPPVVSHCLPVNVDPDTMGTD